MGQKVNPIGLRLGINRTADSRWYADSADFGRLLHEDLAIRKAIRARLKQAGISKIIIERPHKKCLITIHTARPGLVIGKKGGDIETLRKDLAKMTDDEVRVNLVEIRKPEIDATLIADDIARQLERRASFRRTMKRAIDRGAPVLPLEAAVRRLTGEQAEWYGVDAGHLRVGDCADIAVVDPGGLDDSLDDYHEAPMAFFDGLERMVRRNDRAVRATVIGGEVVYEAGAFVEGYGEARRYGRFLRAGQKAAPLAQPAAAPSLAAE